MSLQTIVLDDSRTLRIMRRGSGRPVVLIHGSLTTHADWSDDLVSGLSNHHEVFAVDRPGHGESRRARYAGSPRLQAKQIHDGLEPLLKQPPIIVAHSYGTAAALLYAGLFPTAGVVLVSPVVVPELRLIEQTYLAPRSWPLVGPIISGAAHRTFDRAFLEMAHRAMFFPQPVPADWKATYPWSQVLTPAAFVVEGEDVLASSPFSPETWLGTPPLAVPVRAIAGAADHIVFASAHAAALAALVPNVAIETLPMIGHMVHHAAPAAVAGAIREVDQAARANRPTVARLRLVGS